MKDDFDFDYEKFGNNIRKYRLSKDLTQEALALKCDITTPTMSGIERGKSTPSFPTFIKIIQALDVTPNQLLLNVVSDKESLLIKQANDLLGELDDMQLRYFCEILESFTEMAKNYETKNDED